jgi:hypothetical protein
MRHGHVSQRYRWVRPTFFFNGSINMSRLLLAQLLFVTAMANGSFADEPTEEAGVPAKQVEFTPKQALDYFAGQWRGSGKVGENQYNGRANAEWDLHHNIISQRMEFFGSDVANSLILIRMVDPLKKNITEQQYASWGVYRQGQYDVVPYEN